MKILIVLLFLFLAGCYGAGAGSYPVANSGYAPAPTYKCRSFGGIEKCKPVNAYGGQYPVYKCRTFGSLKKCKPSPY